MYYSLISSMKKFVYDSDALAFINAAAITDNTQKLAINTLVIDLKSYGLWNLFYAIYPFVGGTASTHKFNLRDPRDLNAAYRLTFNGGYTHSSNGIQGNGTNGFANTYFDTQTIGFTNNNHISSYIVSNIDESSIDMGIFQSSFATGLDIESRISNNSYFYNFITGSSTTIANTDARGMYINTRTSSVLNKVYKNDILKSTVTNSTSISFIQGYLTISARSVGYSSAEYYSTKQIGFSSIGVGLTDTQAANYYTAVQKFQVSLGRQFDVPTVSDADAQAFLNAAYITDITQANAINTLVLSLKSAGLWAKMKVIYPFIGGTIFTHKWNLKDPRNLDAAYRLTFYGGANHNNNGIQFNGTNGYANSFFNPYLSQAKSNLHLSIYTRVKPSRYIYANDININASYNPTGQIALRATSNSQGTEFFETSENANGYAFIASTAIGFSIGSRTSNSSIKYYKNTISGSTTGINNEDFRNAQLILNGNGAYQYAHSAAEYAFVSMGDGLTDTESANYYTIVQIYQTTLGRQV